MRYNITMLPKSRLGKWSVGLNAVFMTIIITSLILVLVLNVLSFDDHWWDVTVPIAFLLSMAAFFLGIRAVSKDKERSILVYLSIVIGILVILFIPLHSLSIQD
ncbi:MAG: hypothetical protein C4562_05835 [Actinobacteria bacterium]|nr:MAG: hypothetical protein C4562_05835 [Actinomycetota bacterium]